MNINSNSENENVAVKRQKTHIETTFKAFLLDLIAKCVY